jgi:hypothetical protein
MGSADPGAENRFGMSGDELACTGSVAGGSAIPDTGVTPSAPGIDAKKSLASRAITAGSGIAAIAVATLCAVTPLGASGGETGAAPLSVS